MTPGSQQGLLLVTEDIQAVRDDLAERGVFVSEVFHGSAGCCNRSPSGCRAGGEARVDCGQQITGARPTQAKERDDDAVTVPVATVTSRIEAELMVGFLQSNGLWAAVSADDAGGQEPQLQMQGVRVLVSRADEDSARRLLAAAEDASGPDAGG